MPEQMPAQGHSVCRADQIAYRQAVQHEIFVNIEKQRDIRRSIAFVLAQNFHRLPLHRRVTFGGKRHMRDDASLVQRVQKRIGAVRAIMRGNQEMAEACGQVMREPIKQPRPLVADACDPNCIQTNFPLSGPRPMRDLCVIVARSSHGYFQTLRLIFLQNCSHTPRLKSRQSGIFALCSWILGLAYERWTDGDGLFNIAP
jgi:hypothetical protein